MTQPTISNAPSCLRQTLHDRLFVHFGRGMKPTPKAVTMVGPIRSTLWMIEGGVSGDEDFRIALQMQTNPVKNRKATVSPS